MTGASSAMVTRRVAEERRRSRAQDLGEGKVHGYRERLDEPDQQRGDETARSASRDQPDNNDDEKDRAKQRRHVGLRD